MTINCPICQKELPEKFSMYKDEKIHDIHRFVDELNADVTILSDLVLMARIREKWNRI